MSSILSVSSVKRGSSSASPKSGNNFFISYPEQCRRLKMKPLTYIKPPAHKTKEVLDFITDRIKVQEWIPICKSLEIDDSLHTIALRSRSRGNFEFMAEVNTKEKANNLKRPRGSLFTAYVSDMLIKSIGICLGRNNLLSTLELEGIPVSALNMNNLLQGLRLNNSLTVVKITHYPLRDDGCQKLCTTLREAWNIKVLDLTACDLGTLSGQYIAGLIKYQQINCYTEGCKNSLLYNYTEPGEKIKGLKRITLNNNTDIGDEGLSFILNVLDDESCLKAIDMQCCGITGNIAGHLLDVIDMSRTLEVADFRRNPELSLITIECISNILKSSQPLGYKSDFEWGATTTTLTSGSFVGSSTSSVLPSKSVVPAKSRLPVPSKTSSSLHRVTTSTDLSNKSLLPLKDVAAKSKPSVQSKSISPTHSLHKVKTSTDLSNKMPTKEVNPTTEQDLSIKELLQQLIAKREELEGHNKNLKEELSNIKSIYSLTEDISSQALPQISPRRKQRPRSIGSNTSKHSDSSNVDSRCTTCGEMCRPKIKKQTIAYFAKNQHKFAEMMRFWDIVDNMDKVKKKAYGRAGFGKAAFTQEMKSTQRRTGADTKKVAMKKEAAAVAREAETTNPDEDGSDC